MMMGIGKRMVWAVVLVALAGGLTFAEVTGQFGGLWGANAIYQEWVGVRVEDEGVTRVEIDSSTGPDIEALDAALLLRAVEGFAPRAVVFAEPVAGGANAALLRSKLAGVTFPVVFARKGEALPSDLGSGEGPGARVNFGDLMVEKVRGEGGVISPALDALFRGRIVVCELAIDGARLEARVPGEAWWWGILPVLLVGSVPFWRGGRVDRVVVAGILVGCWLLGALAVGAEFGIVLPVVAAVCLPVVCWFGGRR